MWNLLRMTGLVCAALFFGVACLAKEPATPERGYEVLRKSQFLVPDFDDEILDQLWTVWPEERRALAEKAIPVERRKLAFDLYGIHPLPESPNQYAAALGYVTTNQGDWVMNCLACHGGQVNGTVISGLGNADFDLQSLSEDVRAVKKKLGKPLTHLDGAVGKTMLSAGPGLTAAVNFGVDLGALRDAEMNVHLDREVPERRDYGMDAPPFWNVKYKQRLYCDNHSPNNHRVLMQFILHPWNNGDYVKRQEDKFRAIQAWIHAVEPPSYPFEIDQKLAARGEIVFQKNCSECHGTYQNGKVEYPERVVEIDDVNTDRVRLDELKPEFRRTLAESWMTVKNDGSEQHDEVVIEPVGYLAPPLVGIWASAPYLHNGSVPTLWHLLHPEARPAIWKRTGKEYDANRVGHAVEEFSKRPANFKQLDKYEQRRFYDTAEFGKGNGGHDYPAKLSEQARRAVLEYLKTL